MYARSYTPLDKPMHVRRVVLECFPRKDVSQRRESPLPEPRQVRVRLVERHGAPYKRTLPLFLLLVRPHADRALAGPPQVHAAQEHLTSVRVAERVADVQHGSHVTYASRFVCVTMSQPRRMTLASLDTNQPAAAPKALKPPPVSNRPRMSVARRQSALPPTTSPRRSIARPSMPGRRSMAGRFSMVPGMSVPAVPAKDMRLRSKAARPMIEADLSAFLDRTGFVTPHANHNSRLVHEPTQQAFMDMFKHVYRVCIDEEYKFDEGKKFDDETQQLLRDLQYPFFEDLTKTKLMAAGSHQNWPVCLAMLDWIVRMGTMLNSVGYGPLERTDDNELHAIFFPYLWRCYDLFWTQEVDEFPQQTAELKESFRAKNQELATSTADLEAQHAALQAEYNRLMHAWPRVREEKEGKVLLKDIHAFNDYRETKLLPRMDKTRRHMARLEAEVAETLDELQHRRRELARAASEVEAQGVSDDAYARLTAEREQLTSQLQDIQAQHRGAHERCDKTEVELTRKQDLVESRLAAFHQGAERIALTMPDGVQRAQIALHPAHPTTMLPPGVSMSPVLAKIRDAHTRHTTRATDLESESAARAAAGEALRADVVRLHREHRAREKRLAALSDELAALTRDAADEESAAAKLIAQKRSFVQGQHQASAARLQHAQGRLAEVEAELAQLDEGLQAERQAIDCDMYDALHTLLDLKELVRDGLHEIQRAATAQAKP